MTVAPSLGYIDIFGYSSAADGWLFSGWIPPPPRTDHAGPVEFLAQYEKSQHTGKATLAFYQREDLDLHNGMGIVAFLPQGPPEVGRLQHVVFSLDGITYRAKSHAGTTRLLDQDLVARLRPLLNMKQKANRNLVHLRSLISRSGFTGQNTLDALRQHVMLEIDEAVSCPPDGVVLKGWLLAEPGAVRSVRVRSGPLAAELLVNESIRVARPDVIKAVDPRYGFSEERCGFVAYVQGALCRSDPAYIEVKLENGEVGFKPIEVSKPAGITAIRRILQGIDVRHAELDFAFDHILGPAIRSLNTARLQVPIAATELQFGKTPENPKYTLVIPLYGRIDFVEYQMALFSRHPGVKATEIIYVLDDPPKGRAFQDLARSVFGRFGLAFRALLPESNLGFAPACNLGLRSSAGRFICFLNSDAFPITQDWMERLVARLEANPDIGVIGPRLLYEDGSVQHEGCFFRKLPEFGNWTFGDHYNKGRRPGASQGVRRYEAITGACVVLKRSLAHALGGFDEAYIVGDFEDMDLCRRLQDRGLACAVDEDVQLYHLERKSQSEESWRMNLCLYNAWVFQRRWIEAHALADSEPKSVTGGLSRVG